MKCLFSIIFISYEQQVGVLVSSEGKQGCFRSDMEKSRFHVLVQHHSILAAGLFDVEAEWSLDTEGPFQVGARLF